MSLPYFYEPDLPLVGGTWPLSEASAKHAVQVLRLRKGDQMMLTNGQGSKALAELVSADKKSAVVALHPAASIPLPAVQISLALAPVKHPARLEWLLEKATEMGVSRIVFLHTDHTEKSSQKKERWEQILVSAMLQSQQVFKPELVLQVPFEQAIRAEGPVQKYLAHCAGPVKPLVEILMSQPKLEKGEHQLFIGPEGDFSAKEIAWAQAKGVYEIGLGPTRLRTETAALVGLALLLQKSFTCA
ncbi:MAG: 16S rRNA (uracil(1498)-N(3))-methyltransferase [Sphingobacteriia bacterium]|nr:MAG: 16S rRNA (uracil(1498)-N(3))-methyltransferase [Sphingobacteriia bacterium]